MNERKKTNTQHIIHSSKPMVEVKCVYERERENKRVNNTNGLTVYSPQSTVTNSMWIQCEKCKRFFSFI